MKEAGAYRHTAEVGQVAADESRLVGPPPRLLRQLDMLLTFCLQLVCCLPVACMRRGSSWDSATSTA